MAPVDPLREAVQEMRKLAAAWDRTAKEDLLIMGPGNPAPAARISAARELRDLSDLLANRAKGRKDTTRRNLRRRERKLAKRENREPVFDGALA